MDYEVFPTRAFISEYTNDHRDRSFRKDLVRSLSLPHREHRWGYDPTIMKRVENIPFLIATNPTELITFQHLNDYEEKLGRFGITKEGTMISINEHIYHKITLGNFDLSLLELFKDNNIIRANGKKERYGHISRSISPSFKTLCSLIRSRKLREKVNDSYQEIIDSKDIESESNINNIESLSHLDDFIGKTKKSLTMLYIEDDDEISNCEEENEHLFSFFRRILIAFRLLGKEGTLIIKMSPGYTNPFIELLFLLSIHFRSTTIYRPVMMAPTNEERYLIFKDFAGIPDVKYKVLRSIFSSWTTGKILCCCSSTKSRCPCSIKGYITKIINHDNIPRTFRRWIQRANEDIRDQINEKFEQIDQFVSDIEGKTDLLVDMFKKNIAFCKDWCYSYGIEIDPLYDHGVILKGSMISNYFSREDGIIMEELMLSEEGRYSISRPRDAETITKIIMKSLTNHRPNNLVITEATSNVGGNVINFSKHFKHVNAIEISNFQMKILKNNCSVYKRINVSFYNQNYVDICSNIKQDIIFIDPPWGGVDYKDKDKLELYLSGIPLGDIVHRLEKKAKLIVLKIPINYDFRSFLKNIDARAVTLYKIRNYIILTIRTQV